MSLIQRLALITAGLALTACGTSVTLPATTLTIPAGALADISEIPPVLTLNNPGLSAQSTAPNCTLPASGGASPYSSSGPSWRQWVYPNQAESAPYNYSTFTSDLPGEGRMAFTPYTTSTGTTSTPDALVYQEFKRAPLVLSGTLEGTSTPINTVYVNPSGSYGLVYRPATQSYDLPVNNSSVASYKTFDGSGQIVKGPDGKDQITSGNTWSYPKQNGQTIRLPGDQSVKLEFFLSNIVSYEKMSVLTKYLDPVSNTTKQGWVVVNMPVQKGFLRMTAQSYKLGNSPTAIATGGTPILTPVTMLGFKNTANSAASFVWRKELWYRTPLGVSTTSNQPLFDWLDARRDAVSFWKVYSEGLGRANVNDAGLLSSLTDQQGPAEWNLGTPSENNAKNCISKTIQLLPNRQTYSVISQGNGLKGQTVTAPVYNAAGLTGPVNVQSFTDDGDVVYLGSGNLAQNSLTLNLPASAPIRSFMPTIQEYISDWTGNGTNCVVYEPFTTSAPNARYDNFGIVATIDGKPRSLNIIWSGGLLVFADRDVVVDGHTLCDTSLERMEYDVHLSLRAGWNEMMERATSNSNGNISVTIKSKWDIRAWNLR